VTLDKAWLYLVVVPLITNQFGSVQKMKLPKGRIISEDYAGNRLELTRIHLIDALPKGRKFDAGHDLSRFLSPLPKMIAPYQDDPKRHFVTHAGNARGHCPKTVTWVLDHNSLR
jgi:hypothetical protein